MDVFRSRRVWFRTKWAFSSITMHLTLVVLILAVTGIAEGWECSEECNIENGFCEKPGRCRCKPGWQGENCDQCVPFPGCLHGTCKKAWQCVCEEGWVGSLCNQDTRLCTSRSCTDNATCIETGEGGYMCICPHGYTGETCQMKQGLCLTNGSPCQNGGTCTDVSAAYSSCLCPPGFSGDFCEINIDSCQPNPCLNGGNCTNHGLAFTCVCPHGYIGFTCNETTSLSPCSGRPCSNKGTCVGQLDGTFWCICQKRFTGPTCSLQHRPKARSKSVGNRPLDHRVFALTPQHYSHSAHTFHKLLTPPERDLLKITMKETVHSPGVLVTHGQLICFGMLALLTCLVILGTTGIVFFGRFETWLANAKYSKLVRQQREHLLREAGNTRVGEPEHSVNIILSEKIRLARFGKQYTSI